MGLGPEAKMLFQTSLIHQAFLKLEVKNVNSKFTTLIHYFYVRERYIYIYILFVTGIIYVFIVLN